MSVSETVFTVGNSEVSLVNVVSIIIATAPFGYLFGFLFTVHIIPSETFAVWLTTVALAVLGLIVWSVLY